MPTSIQVIDTDVFTAAYSIWYLMFMVYLQLSYTQHVFTLYFYIISEPHTCMEE